MLQRFFGAVTSFLVLSGGTFAADSHILAGMAINTSQSAISLRLDDSVHPAAARTAAVEGSSFNEDGQLVIDLAMDAFSPNAELGEIKTWYDVMGGLQQPEARLIAKLDQATMLAFLSGARNGVDVPVALELNGRSWDLMAQVSGSVSGGAAISFATTVPLSISLADFGYGPDAPQAQMHFNFVYGNDAVAPAPVALAAAEVPATLAGLQTALRPRLRPQVQEVPRRTASVARDRGPVVTKPRARAAAKPRAERAKAETKEIVKITYTYRETTRLSRAKCADHSGRVARQDLALDAANSNPRVNRTFRRLVDAFNPCR